MSVRFSVTVQNATGDAQTGQNVDLYAHGGAKVGDFTDNGDGTYYYDVTTSGKYDVYVGGVLQDEMTGIYIAADDLVSDISDKADKVSSPTTGDFAGLDANGNLTDSGNSASDFLTDSHKNADGAGSTSAPATNKEHNAAAVELSDSGGYFSTDDVEAALQTIGSILQISNSSLDFASSNYLTSLTKVKDALLALDTKVFEFFIKGNDINAETNLRRMVLTFGFSGNLTGVIGSLKMVDGIACSSTQGIVMMRAGSITGISATWSGNSITTGETINLFSTINGAANTNFALVIDSDNKDDQKIYEVIDTGTLTFAAGDKIGTGYIIDSSGDYLTNVVLAIEITLSTMTETTS